VETQAACVPEKGTQLIRKFGTAVVVGVASLSLLVAACGGGEAKPTAAKEGAPAAAPAAQQLKMQDIKFDRTGLNATKGQALTLSLVNEGALEHDFTIEKINAKATLDGKDAKTDKYAVHALVKAKASGKLEFTPAEAGTFEFFCSVAGHKEAGMKGTLTVK